MGLPWYRAYTLVLNDLGHLIYVRIKHTIVIAGWADSILAPYELAVFFIHLTLVLDQCGDMVCSLYPS